MHFVKFKSPAKNPQGSSSCLSLTSPHREVSTVQRRNLLEATEPGHGQARSTGQFCSLCRVSIGTDKTDVPVISENREPSLSCRVLPCVSLLSVIIHGIPNKDLQSLTTSAAGFLKGAEDELFLAFCLFEQVHCLPENLPSRPPMLS